MKKRPRLMAGHIPKNTPYCYTNLSHDENGYKIRPCPYWKMLDEKDENGNNICYCSYLKQKSYKYDSFSLIWDQVKECGISEDWD